MSKDIPNNGFTAKDVDETDLTIFIGWQRLMRLLARTELTSYEQLVGFSIGEDGLALKIKHNK